MSVVKSNRTFDLFFAKLNGKVYTDPFEMRKDFLDSLDELGYTVKKDRCKKNKK